jgi:hypothetical protein
MDTPAEITLFITVITAAVVAGGQIFCRLAVIPAFGDWSPEFGVSVHQHALTERPHRYLRAVSALSFFAAVATIVIGIVDDSESGAVVLVAIGLALAVFSAAYSQKEWPINDEINAMGDNPSQENVNRYGELRRLWDSQHTIRTIATVLALLCFVAAAAFY